MSFSQLVSEFLSFPNIPEKVKSKKKKKRLSDFGPPLLRIPGHAPGAAAPVIRGTLFYVRIRMVLLYS